MGSLFCKLTFDMLKGLFNMGLESDYIYTYTPLYESVFIDKCSYMSLASEKAIGIWINGAFTL